jgi:hypothetical protein
MVLIVDCCALVHAEQMGNLGQPPLAMLESLALKGVRFVTTARVWGELENSSLRNTLSSWAAKGWIRVQNVTFEERKAVANCRKRGDDEPGDNDKALIALSKRLDAPLLTHDKAASLLAGRRCGVTVLDLADVVGSQPIRSCLSCQANAWCRSPMPYGQISAPGAHVPDLQASPLVQSSPSWHGVPSGDVA